MIGFQVTHDDGRVGTVVSNPLVTPTGVTVTVLWDTHKFSMHDPRDLTAVPVEKDLAEVTHIGPKGVQ